MLNCFHKQLNSSLIFIDKYSLLIRRDEFFFLSVCLSFFFFVRQHKNLLTKEKWEARSNLSLSRTRRPEATTINNIELSSFLLSSSSFSSSSSPSSSLSSSSSVLLLTMLTGRQQIFVWVHSLVTPQGIDNDNDVCPSNLLDRKMTSSLHRTHDNYLSLFSSRFRHTSDLIFYLFRRVNVLLFSIFTAQFNFLLIFNHFSIGTNEHLAKRENADCFLACFLLLLSSSSSSPFLCQVNY